jgi:hypothetical protein
MPGLGKKTFTAGDVLIAGDVNGYLMDQTVMKFGGTAARTSALPVPSEGMFSVTTDNDQVDYYDGGSWAPALRIGAWTAYTPTFVNFTLGNGTVTSFFCRNGKTVHLTGSITFGSTSSIATFAGFILPINSARIEQNGSSCYTDTGAVSVGGITRTTSVNIASWTMSNSLANFGAVGAAHPFTWGNGDILSWTLTYEGV